MFMNNEEYKKGYAEAENLIRIFGDSGDGAILRFFNNLLDKRNSINPNDYDSALEYDNIMDWFDGQLDYTEKYISEKIS